MDFEPQTLGIIKDAIITGLSLEPLGSCYPQSFLESLPKLYVFIIVEDNL